MKLPNLQLTFLNRHSWILIGIFCFTVLSASSSALLAQQPAAPAQSQTMTTTTDTSTQEPAPKISNDQLDSLVAPIALYPDPLVAQVLAASTYPLEIVQLAQWMANNKTLKDKALADAVAKLPYDPSVQSLAAFPDVVKQLSEHVSWTMDLGNAFLAQQTDVMDALQRMRAKAQGSGNLKTTAQQKVETETVESGKQVITIEPADPQVVYVPQYSPTVVYGTAPPAYPYPYPYPPGYGMLAFGTGVAMGAAWGACWGNCDWHGGGNVTVNNNNNFNRNNINTGNRNQISNRPNQGGNRPNQGGGNWQHNPSHRGGAPYGDRGTANKFGGQAQQRPAGGAGNRPGGGAGTGGLGRGQGVAGGNRPSGGTGNLGGANRPGGGTGNVGGSRPGGGAGASTRPAGGSSFGGGGNSIGNRSVSPGGGFGSSNNAFGGGGFGGNSARSASSRGGHSMGGGGFSGGGGRGGGGRGGGGRGGGGGGGRRR